MIIPKDASENSRRNLAQKLDKDMFELRKRFDIPVRNALGYSINMLLSHTDIRINAIQLFMVELRDMGYEVISEGTSDITHMNYRNFIVAWK